MLLIAGAAMIPSIICGLINREFDVSRNFLIIALAGIGIGAVGRYKLEKQKGSIKVGESYFVVLLCWLTVVIYGMMPYIFSTRGYSISDSFFESAASWTTTSAFVLDINKMPKALVMWKATANWMGGVGIILAAVQIMAGMGITGQNLARAEVPGPVFEKSMPRIQDTAKLTYMVYGTLSIIEFLLLLAGRIPVFDALINTMSSISTAGVMDYQGNVAMHFTPYIKTVLVVFSIIGSLNFLIFIRLSRKQFKAAFEDYEMQVFLKTILASTLLITVILRVTNTYSSFFSALINGLVATVSFGCTTGINIEQITTWPPVIKAILIILMIGGGCSNSTSGGLKVIRVVVFFKLIKRGIYKRIHPRAMRPIRIRGNAVSVENAGSISMLSAFIMMSFALYFFSTVVLSLSNFDMETVLSAPIALLTNTGTGFGRVSLGYYGDFGSLGKIYSGFLMLAGRLEIYALMLAFLPTFWKGTRTKKMA